MEEFGNIDKLFAQELKEHAPSPPANMWEKIEERLPQKQSKKTPFLFFKIAASIALLLSAGSLGIYILTNTPNEINLITSEVINKNNSQIISPLSETSETELKLKNSSAKTSASQINTAKSQSKEIYAGNAVSATDNITNVNTISEDVNTISETDDENQDLIIQEAKKPFIISENSINSIEPEIINQSENNESIIYQTKKPEYSEAYKDFLSEFESLDEEGAGYSKWAISGQGGPQYTYRQITSDNVSQEYIDKYNNSESGLIAYAGGVSVAYKPARRLSIQSGVYYSKMGQTAPAQEVQNWENIYGGYTQNPRLDNSNVNTNSSSLRISSSMGVILEPAVSNSKENYFASPSPSPSPSVSYGEVSQVNQYLEFLEIPLMARYAIIDRKINFHFLGGLSTNFLIASPVYLDNGDYYSEAENLNVVNYSGTIGLGLGYKLSGNFSFNIEPQFKYYLNKINTNSETEVHPYSYGIFSGITYLF